MDEFSNIRQVQADIAPFLRSGQINFIPNDRTLLKILEVSEHNRHCPLNERIALNDPQVRQSFSFLFLYSQALKIPEFNPELCEYTLAFSRLFKRKLLTRNPETGEVTEHIHPYPRMPRFKTTANPWMTFSTSYKLCQLHNIDSPLLLRVGAAVCQGQVPRLFRPHHPNVPSTCPSLTRDSASCSTSSGSLSTADSTPSDTDVEYLCGSTSEPEVSRWLETLPPPTTQAEVAEDDDQVRQYTSEPIPAPKGPADDDPTNWRSVGRRCFPHIMAGLTIPGHTELLPPYTDSLLPSEPGHVCQPSKVTTPESSTHAPRRPHTTEGRPKERPSSRVCPARRSKTVATAAMTQQLRTRRAIPPRSDNSSLKRKRAVDTTHPRSEDRPETTNGDRRIKKARVETRKTRSLPARVARTAAATAITFQLGRR